MIDPWDGEEVWRWAEKEKVILSGVLNTHQHHDHIRGNAHLKERGIPVLKETEALRAWATPGHTLEHVIFLLKDEKEEIAFVGDTLFQAGVGNCKNGGDPGALYHTILKLKQRLSPSTWILPGHDYLERNLAFAHHVLPANPAIGEAFRGLGGKPTHDLPPTQWRDELRLNPFLLLARGGEGDEIEFKQLRQQRDVW